MGSLPTLEPGEKGERGVLYWVGGDWIRQNRQERIRRVHNRDGHRINVEQSYSTDKSIAPVDYEDGDLAVIEKPPPLKLRTARETTELLAKVVADNMLALRQSQPEVYRRTLAALRDEHPEYRAKSDADLTSIIMDFARATMAEPSVRRITSGRKLGGWRGPVLKG